MTTTTVTINPESGKLEGTQSENTGSSSDGTTVNAGELFDPKPFELAIPRLDGHKADKLVLAFGGSIELDRTDEDDLKFLERLRLGEDIGLAVTARCAGKGFVHALKGEDEEEVVGYRISLKVHSLDVPESAE